MVPVQAAEGTIFTDRNGALRLSNPYYEIVLDQQDGTISAIFDKKANRRVSEGSNGHNLWAATFDQGPTVESNAYVGRFTYQWEAEKSTLTLNYAGDLGVTISLRAPNEPLMQMQAVVTNGTKANLKAFNFPYQLRVIGKQVKGALMPMIPGALLSSDFFANGRSYVNEYPGGMFADYLAVRYQRGNLTLYGLHSDPIQPAFIGYERTAADSPYMHLTHKYMTWVNSQKTWKSPTVVVRVGQDYPATIAAYRTENGIDQYKSLKAKLGDKAERYFGAPYYKLDLAALKMPFTKLKSDVIDKINVPGIIEFVVIQKGGHDNGYPEFIPPDPKWGTPDEFAELVGAIQSKGGLVVPYVNLSWWDTDGAILKTLPDGLSLPDVTVKGTDMVPLIEKYGPNAGYVMNLNHPFVKAKISEQHTALLKTIGVDGIFEDQWAARNAPYNFEAAGLDHYDPATSYFGGVLDHYQDHADSFIMTEMGIDVLANNGVAFAGSNYLWDMLGYRGLTASATTYYPMAAMMLRDKVLLYQHNLAAETWTKNKDMLRWNLSQGYGLSNAFFDQSQAKLRMDNAWLNLIGVFQKYALANYADELVSSYDDLGGDIKRTVFESYTVTANGDKNKPRKVGDHVLPAGGVITQANDGSVTAGVFSSYNGKSLSEGDHYLVEVRGTGPDSGVKIFQPVGAETAIRIKVADAKGTVTAYRYDGTRIGDVKATVAGKYVTFTYAGEVDGKQVGYYMVN